MLGVGCSFRDDRLDNFTSRMVNQAGQPIELVIGGAIQLVCVTTCWIVQ